MPIYEYRCDKCGQTNEVWQKFSDPPLHKCEACGGPVKKIISHNTFHLKGTGWYVTDYASKSSGGRASHKENTQTTTKDEGKKESKKDARKED